MTKASQLCMIALVSCTASLAAAADSVSWPSTLPVYDHIVIVVEVNHDMHNGKPDQSIPAGDRWLQQNLDGYYQWAKTHNSLLIVTFDENDDQSGYYGLTNPLIGPNPQYSPRHNRLLRDIQNRIVTIFAGAHIKPGWYAEGKGITHVNILRTIEAMYGLPKSGAQQPNAAGGGIADETIITDVFESVR
jgi:phosphatidylinositol-3-phosphatase